MSRQTMTSSSWASQPSGHITGCAFTDNVFTPTVKNSDGKPVAVICKGAELAPDAAADGVLAVHPIDSPADSWYLMPLYKGQRNGCVFDKVGDDSKGTTIADVTTKVTFFPE